FAINNYFLALRRRGLTGERLTQLAKEAIAADPHDPGGYMRLMELCYMNDEFAEALEVAERLQRLFEPVMNQRALYCLRQNPACARQIDSGKYNPGAENRRRIAFFRSKVPVREAHRTPDPEGQKETRKEAGTEDQLKQLDADLAAGKLTPLDYTLARDAILGS